MGNSQNKDLSSQKKELSNTNLGVINLSAEDISAIGWKEILEILSFIILIWTVWWCCKKKKKEFQQSGSEVRGNDTEQYAEG